MGAHASEIPSGFQIDAELASGNDGDLIGKIVESKEQAGVEREEDVRQEGEKFFQVFLQLHLPRLELNPRPWRFREYGLAG